MIWHRGPWLMDSPLAGGQWQARYWTGLSCGLSCLTTSPKVTEDTVIWFADDITLRAPVNIPESRAVLQGDVQKREEMDEQDTDKVLHHKRSNPLQWYTLDTVWLRNFSGERSWLSWWKICWTQPGSEPRIQREPPASRAAAAEA